MVYKHIYLLCLHRIAELCLTCIPRAQAQMPGSDMLLPWATITVITSTWGDCAEFSPEWNRALPFDAGQDVGPASAKAILLVAQNLASHAKSSSTASSDSSSLAPSKMPAW